MNPSPFHIATVLKKGNSVNGFHLCTAANCKKKQFLYTGPDINAVLDRLPTAKALKQKDGSYLVDVEVFGSIGLTMLLNSQGDYVKILS